MSLETKRAFFWAALVAECAREPRVTGSRIVASLLRTESVRAFCARTGIDSARAFAAMDDPSAVPYEECERQVLRDLSEKGCHFASREHRASVHPRPLEPVVRDVVGRL